MRVSLRTLSNSRSGNRNGVGIGSLLFGTLFLGAFAAGGIFFFVMLGQELWKIVDSYQWENVIGEVVSGGVRTDNSSDENPYRATITYRYEWKGQSHTSSFYQHGYSGSSSYTDAQRLVDRYVPGSAVTIYINPRNPSQSALKHGSLFMAPFLLIPVVFMLVGFGGIFWLWKSFLSRNKETPISSQTISNASTKSSSGNNTVRIIGVILSLVGWGLLIFLVIPNLWKSIESTRWPQVSCKVISSNVRSHDSDDGTTYSIDILYAYEYKGTSYRCNNYDMIGGSSSGYKGKREIVRKYPAGSMATCFVNPGDPYEAVLRPGVGWLHLLGLIPLVMGIVGIAMLFPKTFGAGQRPQASTITGTFSQIARTSGGVSHPGQGWAGSGPVELKPTAGPVFKFIGILLFTLIWNGVVTFLYFAAIDEGGVILWIFFAVFGAVGVATACGTVYQLLALFNPRPIITVNSAEIPLGETLEASWRFSGSAHCIDKLTLTLEMREEATYRRGTRTYTDKETVYKTTLYESFGIGRVASGSCAQILPGNAMPTFEASNNKVIWELKLQASIPRWPDISLEYPIRTLPPLNPQTPPSP